MKKKKFKHTILMVPNVLSMMRILVVPLILFFVYLEGKTGNTDFGVIGLIIFLLASGTDFLDGYFARRLKMKSSVGKILDPLVDKIMVTSLLIMMTHIDRIPAGIVIVIVCREFIITALRSLAALAGIVMPAGWLGKLKTNFQMAAITFLLIETKLQFLDFHILGLITLWMALFFSLWSGYVYIKGFYGRAKDIRF